MSAASISRRDSPSCVRRRRLLVHDIIAGRRRAMRRARAERASCSSWPPKREFGNPRASSSARRRCPSSAPPLRPVLPLGHSPAAASPPPRFFAFSDRVGLGHIQAAPYGAPRAQREQFISVQRPLPLARRRRAHGRDAARGGLIAPLENLRKPIAVYAGAVGRSSITRWAPRPPTSTASSAPMSRPQSPNASHAFCTDGCAPCNPCDYLGPPFINDCGTTSRASCSRTRTARSRRGSAVAARNLAARPEPLLPPQKTGPRSMTARAYVPPFARARSRRRGSMSRITAAERRR